MGALLILGIIGGFFGLIGWAIGHAKGRGGEGFALGFFLSFLGWIIVAIMRPTPRAEAERQLAIERMKKRMRDQRGDPG